MLCQIKIQILGKSIFVRVQLISVSRPETMNALHGMTTLASWRSTQMPSKRSQWKRTTLMIAYHVDNLALINDHCFWCRWSCSRGQRCRWPGTPACCSPPPTGWTLNIKRILEKDVVIIIIIKVIIVIILCQLNEPVGSIGFQSRVIIIIIIICQNKPCAAKHISLVSLSSSSAPPHHHHYHDFALQFNLRKHCNFNIHHRRHPHYLFSIGPSAGDPKPAE